MTRLASAAALALLLLAAMAAPAAAATPDPFLGDPFDQNQQLSYRWGSGGAPPTAIRDAIRAAVADANSTDKSKAGTFEYTSGAGNTIAYGVDAPCGENGLACFRRNAPDWFAVYLRENGHRYDWGTLRWCEATGRPNGCYDAENITLDELGHVLGLDHHVNLPDDSDYGDAVVQTYSRTKPSDFYNAHAFGRCDVATLQQVYDVPSTSTLYSTCLDVPTALAVSASKTWVQAPASVWLTAILKSDGTGKLSNNFVSGRVVVLQQRTASGWVDVTTMAPGTAAGTYSASFFARATTDLRALFRHPSNEGLRATSSAAVTVVVSVACTTAPCPLSASGTGR